MMPDAVTRCAVRYLVEAIYEEFANPEQRKNFEAWYQKRYGKPYVWRTLHETVSNESSA